MVHRSQISSTERKRHRLQIQQELDKFEQCENELMAQERQERAKQLGLALHGLLKETAN
jgi:hypothetical protein